MRLAVPFAVAGLLLAACGVIDRGEVTARSEGSWSNELAEGGIGIWIENGTGRTVEVVGVSLLTEEQFANAYSIEEVGYELVDSNAMPVEQLEPLPLAIGKDEISEIFVRYTPASCDDIGEWSINEETGLVDFRMSIGLPFLLEFADGEVLQTTALATVSSDFYQPSVCQ